MVYQGLTSRQLRYMNRFVNALNSPNDLLRVLMFVALALHVNLCMVQSFQNF